MPKSKAVGAAASQAIGTFTKADAEKLDAEIDAKMRAFSAQLALAYLEVAAALKRMRDTEGYRLLGNAKWEEYLESKEEYGRTYLSYLYKLGQAGDLSKYLQQGITGSKLIEFAKRTDYPEKIPQLIEATWETVKDKTIRETAIILNKHVSSEEAEYKKPKRETTGGRQRTPAKEKLLKEYISLPETKRKAFLESIKDFMKEVKNLPV